MFGLKIDQIILLLLSIIGIIVGISLVLEIINMANKTQSMIFGWGLIVLSLFSVVYLIIKTSKQNK